MHKIDHKIMLLNAMVKTKTFFFCMHVERLIYVIEFHNNWKNKKVDASFSMCVDVDPTWNLVANCNILRMDAIVQSRAFTWVEDPNLVYIEDVANGIQSIGNKIYHLGRENFGKILQQY
jgi:hypothetical protein